MWNEVRRIADWSAEYNSPIDWINRSIWMAVVAVVASMILKARRGAITKGVPEAVCASLAIATFYTKCDMNGRSASHYERIFLLSILFFKFPISLAVCFFVRGVLKWMEWKRESAKQIGQLRKLGPRWKTTVCRASTAEPKDRVSTDRDPPASDPALRAHPPSRKNP